MAHTASEKPGSAGFTLVELMIVIGVIAILLGIYIGNATSATEETRAMVCEKNRCLYEEAEAMFRHREGRPSNTIQELVEKKYVSKATCPRGGVLTWEVIDPESALAHQALLCSLHGPRSRINAWPALPPPSGQYAFSDGFDEDVAAGWVQVKGKYWEMVDGKLRAGRDTKNSGEHRSFSGDADWTDYSVSLDATLHRGQGFGVFFRATDPDAVDGYVFQYQPGTTGKGWFQVRKYEDGKNVARVGRARPPEGFEFRGTERDIRIDVKGDTYTAFVDGQQVLSVQDSTYTKGGIGLRVWGQSMADFDNVQVELDE